MAHTKATERAGLTLFEVMVSMAIVSILALALMAANVPLTRASSEVGVAYDLDRAGGRFLTDLRTELSQSGYNGTDIQVEFSTGIDNPPAGSITTAPFSTLGPFRRRVDWGTVVDDTGTPWSRKITYRLNTAPAALGNYADGVVRYRVERIQDGEFTTDVLQHVKVLSVTLFPQTGNATAHVKVELTLRRENPGWRGNGSSEGQFIERIYRDDIELLNKMKT
jgi:prepilin-type N-terminal cleavage/methylation domain-containing protein